MHNTEKSIVNRLPWEAVLFFAFYVISPEYLGIEISGKLPLISASRALLVILFAGTLIRSRNQYWNAGRLSLRGLNLGLTGDRFLRAGLFIYFGLMIVTHGVLFFTDAPEAVKALCILAAEEFALVWILTLCLQSRQQVLQAMKVMICASAVVSVIAMVGCIISYNPFHLLKTVHRDMLMTSYYRLGLLRAEAGFGHPVFYGAFCTIMMPMCMYFVERGEKKSTKIFYGLCMALNFVGVILSNSRGSQLALGCLGLIILVERAVRRGFVKLIRTYLPVLAASLAVLLIVSALSPAGVSFLGNVSQSLINEVTSGDSSVADEPDDEVIIESEPNVPGTSENVPPEKEPVEYGENQNGLASRMKQLSGIRWTLERQPIFGFGANAHTRGLVCYQMQGDEWWHTKTFDMAIVAIICQYGLVGLAAFGCLYLTMGKTVIAKKYRKEPLTEYLALTFAAYMLCLLSISSLDKMGWVLMALIVCLVNITEKKGDAHGEA